MKKLFLGANWKMNPIPTGALEKNSPYVSSGNPEVVVFPTFVDLHQCIASNQLKVGAQCGKAEASGALTGDVSMTMLKKMGCTHVLCGHSERRKLHHETDEEVGRQFKSALDVELMPVLCIGETAEERDQEKTNDVLKLQLSFLSTQSSKLKAQSFLVAYEPVWAISGGDPNKPASTSAEAQSMHQFIRSILPKELQSVRILYGGSMKGSNAAELLAQPDIDGALVGGAALVADQFVPIARAAIEKGK